MLVGDEVATGGSGIIGAGFVEAAVATIVAVVALVWLLIKGVSQIPSVAQALDTCSSLLLLIFCAK